MKHLLCVLDSKIFSHGFRHGRWCLAVRFWGSKHVVLIAVDYELWMLLRCTSCITSVYWCLLFPQPIMHRHVHLAIADTLTTWWTMWISLLSITYHSWCSLCLSHWTSVCCPTAHRHRSPILIYSHMIWFLWSSKLSPARLARGSWRSGTHGAPKTKQISNNWRCRWKALRWLKGDPYSQSTSEGSAMYQDVNHIQIPRIISQLFHPQKIFVTSNACFST